MKQTSCPDFERFNRTKTEPARQLSGRNQGDYALDGDGLRIRTILLEGRRLDLPMDHERMLRTYMV